MQPLWSIKSMEFSPKHTLCLKCQEGHHIHQKNPFSLQISPADFDVNRHMNNIKRFTTTAHEEQEQHTSHSFCSIWMGIFIHQMYMGDLQNDYWALNSVKEHNHWGWEASLHFHRVPSNSLYSFTQLFLLSLNFHKLGNTHQQLL